MLLYSRILLVLPSLSKRAYVNYTIHEGRGVLLNVSRMRLPEYFYMHSALRRNCLIWIKVIVCCVVYAILGWIAAISYFLICKLLVCYIYKIEHWSENVMNNFRLNKIY